MGLKVIQMDSVLGASVYDYEFSSDIDVILKGYYPVAAYLWIRGVVGGGI